MKQENFRQSKRSWRKGLALFCAAVLIAPAVAMQFTNEVAWGPEDFGAAAVLLAFMWIAVEIISRLPATRIIKTATFLPVEAALVLTWAHLAVGVF